MQNYFADCDLLVKSSDGFKEFPFQPAPADNARNGRNTKEGFPSINAQMVDVANLPTNPDDDSTFLRYDKSSPLNKIAFGKPVGVPPE